MSTCISSPWIHPSYLSYLYQVFDLRHCYEEMQRQAREACVAVAAQTAAVRGIYNYSAPHTCTYMYMYTRARTKVAKQHSKLRQQKRTNIRRFARVSINVALTLIGYGMPPKLDYYFITITSLVPVAVSTWI